MNINQHFGNLVTKAAEEGTDASQLITQRDRLFKDKVIPELVKRKANDAAIAQARLKFNEQTDTVMSNAGLLPKAGQSSRSFAKDKRAEKAIKESARTGSQWPIIKETIMTTGETVGNLFGQGVGGMIEGAAGFVRDIGENEKDSISAKTAKYGKDLRKGYESSASTYQKELQAGQHGKIPQLSAGAIQSVPAMALPFGAAKGVATAAIKVPMLAGAAPYLGLAAGKAAELTQNYGEVRRNATANLERDFPTWEKLQGNPLYQQNFNKLLDSGVNINQARQQARAETLDALSEGAANKYGTAMTALGFIAPSGAVLGSGILKNAPTSRIGKALVGGGVSADLIRREMTQAPRVGMAKLIPDISKTANIAAAKMVGKQALEEGLQGGIGEYGAQAASANIGGQAVDYKKVGQTILEEGLIGGIMGGGMQSALGGSPTSQAKEVANQLRNQTNALRQEEAAARKELADATQFNDAEKIQSAQINLQNIGAEANKVKAAYGQYGIETPHFVERFASQYQPQQEPEQQGVDPTAPPTPEAAPQAEPVQPTPAAQPAPVQPTQINKGMASTTNLVMDSVTKGLISPEEAQAIQTDPILGQVFSLVLSGDQAAAHNIVMNAVSLGNIDMNQAQNLIESIPRYAQLGQPQKPSLSGIVNDHVKQQIQPQAPSQDGGLFSNAVDLDPNTLEPIDQNQPSPFQDDFNEPKQFMNPTRASDYVRENGLADSHELVRHDDGVIEVRPRQNSIPEDPNLNDFGYNPAQNMQPVAEDPNLTDFSDGAVNVDNLADGGIPEVLPVQENEQAAEPTTSSKKDFSKPKIFSNMIKAKQYVKENQLEDTHEIIKLEDGRIQVQLKAEPVTQQKEEAPAPEQKEDPAPSNNPSFADQIRDAHINNPKSKAKLINDEIAKGRSRPEVLKEIADVVKSVNDSKPKEPELEVKKEVEKDLSASKEGSLLAEPAPSETVERIAMPKQVSLGMGQLKTTPIDKPVYREMNLEGFEDLVRDTLLSSGSTKNLFVTDNIDLALGQGGNKGILVQLRGDAVSGKEHKKPMSGDLTGREYKTDFLSIDSIDQFILPKDTKLRSPTRRGIQGQFTYKKLDDGSILATRKGVTVQPLDEMRLDKSEQEEDQKTDENGIQENNAPDGMKAGDIGRGSDGKPFLSKNAAKRGLKLRDVENTHEIIEIAPSNFVLREKAKSELEPIVKQENKPESEQPTENPFQKYDELAKQYGRSVKPDGSITKANGQDTQVKIIEKKGRLHIEDTTGKLLFTGAPNPESLGKFLEDYWYDKKQQLEAKAEATGKLEPTTETEEQLTATDDIGRASDNAPFSNESSANLALKKKGLEDSYAVVRLAPSQFVLRDKSQIQDTSTPIDLSDPVKLVESIIADGRKVFDSGEQIKQGHEVTFTYKEKVAYGYARLGIDLQKNDINEIITNLDHRIVMSDPYFSGGSKNLSSNHSFKYKYGLRNSGVKKLVISPMKNGDIKITATVDSDSKKMTRLKLVEDMPETKITPTPAEPEQPTKSVSDIQVNDEIVFSKDFDYAEAGKPYKVISVAQAKIVVQSDDGSQLSLPTKTLNIEREKNTDLVKITKAKAPTAKPEQETPAPSNNDLVKEVLDELKQIQAETIDYTKMNSVADHFIKERDAYLKLADTIDDKSSAEYYREEAAKSEKVAQAAKKPANTETKQDDSNVQQLDQTSGKTLEAVSTGDVPGVREAGDSARKTATSSRTDIQGGGPTRTRRDDTGRSVADSEREVSIPSGRNDSNSGLDPKQAVVADNAPVDAFVIDEKDIGKGGKKTKFKANIEAIKVIKLLEAENRPATKAEQKVLSKFVGWGGLAEAFKREDGSISTGWTKEVAELESLLTKKELEAAVDSSIAAHYTSPEIVKALWQAVSNFGFKNGRVLEPSVGVGNFFGLMPKNMRKASNLYAVELDNITGAVAKNLYPEANIKAPMGFQDYQTIDNYFDIAIGNPPFSSITINDRVRAGISGFSLHNYFFAKSVDSLKPNGVLAMVVTNRFLDKMGDKERAYISERAELVGAIRLPNDAFLSNAGTQVTTDIIFLRKKAEGETSIGEAWLDVKNYTDKDGNTVPLNEYFVKHPENMLGDFGAYGSMYRDGEPALIKREGQNTEQLLNEVIEKLPKDVFKAEPSQDFEETRQAVIRDISEVKIGSKFVNSDGQIHERLPDVMGEQKSQVVEFTNDKARNRVAGMIQTAEKLSQLRTLQLDKNATDKQIATARKELNTEYDAFVKENGFINSDTNKRLMRDDPNWAQLSALENKYDRGISASVAKATSQTFRKPSAEKAAIFSKRTQVPVALVESVSSAQDALTESLNRHGYVNTQTMQQLYAGKSESEIIVELGELIYDDPINGYVVRDDYLSGNVKQKLAIAKEQAEKDPKYERNVRALEKVIPADIEALDIDVKLGSHWIPENYMSDFVSHITGSPNGKAEYTKLLNKWEVNPSGVSAASSATYGTDRVDTRTMLNYAINGKKPTVYDRFSDGTSTINQDATLEAGQRVELLRTAWRDWIWEDDARREHIERLYNDVFNTSVNREYDGSHLSFQGMNSGIELRPHQKNAVWRSVQSKATLYDHTVGAGKTFTVIAAAMEMRRMGIVNKPLIVVPNHLVGQWANDFVLLYPNANILAATKKDFEKANRKRFIAKMANGDYDAIIIAHSSFGKISISPEQEQSFIDSEIAEIMEFESALREKNESRSRNAKAVAKRRLALEEKKKNLLNRENKDTDNIYWHELGIDSVMLDEAHEFKNLEFNTSMQNVAGLGTGKGSQKAKDLFAKIQIMQGNNPKSKLIFATGTPISNTMAEMFTMQRYLDWDNLKSQGINHFDAWATVFGEVVSDWELSPSGKYKLTNRFAKFVNMPELMQGYLGFSDVMNRDDINAQLAKEGKTLGTPLIKGNKPQNVVVERSDDQADYIGMPSIDENGFENYPEGSLVWRTENLPRKPEKGADNMLKIMGDARKAALDMRLIDPTVEDFEGSKVNVAANSIYETYKKWNAKKGTQLVFCDLSTPKGAVAAEKARIEQLVKLADDGDEAAQAELDKLSPDELSALDSDFSVYDDLKAKLIAKGMKESEVVFIHDAKTELQKQELFEKVKRGDIRVLMGSTAKMGAGMNVQNRLVALHHLDAPWRPSDLEQREGRIIRQGNEFYKADPTGFEIEISRYATKQTLDSRMWQTIESKAKFIEQVRKGAGTTRVVEDVAGEAANAAEMKAASSGDPRILEEMDLRKQIKDLQDDKKSFDRGVHRTKGIIKSTENDIALYGRVIESLSKDLTIKQPEKFVFIEGKTKINQEDKGARENVAKILESGIKSALAKGKEEYLGQINGFKVSATPSSYVGNADIYLEGNSDPIKLGRYEIGSSSSVGLVQKALNHIKSLPEELKGYQDALKSAQEQIPVLNNKVKDAKWDKSDQLKELETKHNLLIEELKPKKKETPAQPEQKNSRRDNTGTGSTPAQVRTELVNRFGEDVISQLEQQGVLSIIESHSEQGVEGFAENGKVTLVADAITPENIVPVFLHELGGHVGMQGVLKPSAYDNLMSDFDRLVKAGNPDALEAKRLAERETDKEIQKDEYLPYLITVTAKNQQKQSAAQRLVSRVLGAIKAWAVHKLGLNLKLNANDILALAERMVKTVAKNPPPTPPKGKLKTDQTETEAFKKWFSDSKVIDESGKPKIVYHGTNQSFNIFNVSDVGIHAGTMDQANSRKGEKNSGEFRVMPLYMRINNPLRLKDSPSWKDPAFYIQKTGIAQHLSAPLVKRITGFYDELKGIDLKTVQGQEQALDMAMAINRRVTKELKAQGYDGIVYKNTHDGTSLENKMREDDAWIVFDPEQIKSATNNNGDFDSSNPDIRYSRSSNPANMSRSKQRELLDAAAKTAFGQMSLRNAERAKTLSNRTLNLFQTMLHKSLTDKSGDFKKTFDLVQGKINHVTFASTRSMDVAPNVLTQLEEGSDYWKEAKRVGRTLGNGLSGGKIEKAKIDKDLEKIGTLLFENTLLDNSERHTDKELRQLGFDGDQIGLYNEVREAIDTSLDTFANTTFSNIYKHLGGTNEEVLELEGLNLEIHAHYNEVLKRINALTNGKPEMVDARQAAIEAIDKVFKKANDLKDEGYVPLMRFGKYFVRIYNPTTGEVAYRQHFESESERNMYYRKHANDDFPAGFEMEQGRINELQHKLFQGVSPETVALFAKESGLPIGDAEKAYIKFAVKNNHALKRLLRRQGIDGFDTDLKRVLAAFVMSNARYSANQTYNPAIDDSILNIKDPAYQEDAIRLRDYSLDTQEELAPLKNFAFVYYMGFSAMFGVVNLTQPFLQTLPFLMQYTKDHGTIFKAMGKAITTWRKGTDTMDQKYKAHYERARKEGHLDPQNTWMMQGLERGKSGLGASTWQLFSHASGMFAQASETVNRRTTLFAALDVAESMGQAKLEKLGFKDAYDFAVRTIQETQGIYNKGNRPRVARGNIGSVLMMYKQFMISYIEQMSRMQKSGLYGGEDDEFKKKMAALVGFGISRSVLVMLGILMSVSGATGLPFVRDILDGIETAGGLIGKPVNTEREVQIALHDALGQTLGSAVNTALMDGFVNLNPLIDVKGRMGMGDLIPATAYFSPTTSDYMKSAELSNIAGPMGGLLEKVKESVALAQVGAYGQAGVQLLPKAATSMGQGVIAATTGDYRNMKTGVKTNDATVLDGIIKTLDAQPAGIAKEGRIRGLEMKDKAAKTAVNARWKERYEAALDSGERASISAVKQEIKEYNQENPRYPITFNKKTTETNYKKSNQKWQDKRKDAKGLEWMDAYNPYLSEE